MSRRVIVGAFDRETDVIAATQAARDGGYIVEDVYTPYAVHGLDRAMGLKPSWLTWVCFAFGAFGLVFAVWLQFWTSTVAWPINVGGRPWNSLPAFVPIAFELMVLSAGVGTVLVFFVRRRLRPGKRCVPFDVRTTNDRFILVLDGEGPSDLGDVRRLLESCHATAVDERQVAAENAHGGRTRATGRLNLGLGVALAATLAGYWALGVDPLRPNFEFMPSNMVHAVSAQAFATSSVLPRGQTLQDPPPGSIARGLLPWPYAATPGDAARAGVELSNPFPPDDPAAVARGAAVYATFCQVCHGAGGLGDGPVTTRGVPPPVSLLADRARQIRDGQIFHILTYGQKNMSSYTAQIPREDRWKVILHVRQLQQRLMPPTSQSQVQTR